MSGRHLFAGHSTQPPLVTTWFTSVSRPWPRNGPFAAAVVAPGASCRPRDASTGRSGAEHVREPAFEGCHNAHYRRLTPGLISCWNRALSGSWTAGLARVRSVPIRRVQQFTNAPALPDPSFTNPPRQPGPGHRRDARESVRQSGRIGRGPRTVGLPRRCGDGHRHRRAGPTTGQPSGTPQAQRCSARHGGPGQCLVWRRRW
jgi:hypothetical protein